MTILLLNVFLLSFILEINFSYFFSFVQVSLLRYNFHTINYIHLKYTIRCILTDTYSYTCEAPPLPQPSRFVLPRKVFSCPCAVLPLFPSLWSADAEMISLHFLEFHINGFPYGDSSIVVSLFLLVLKALLPKRGN